MNEGYRDLAVVIPSLNPSMALVDYVTTLVSQGFTHLYIVNDGSEPACAPVFAALADMTHCTVLTHAQNQGKGAALKTAYHHIAHTFPHCHGVLTADSDGQHAVKDVCALAHGLGHCPEGLLLGGRNFSKQGVPLNSWLGNRFTSVAFFLFHGTWVQDTQTGLRGFDSNLLPLMLEIPGERFEYEMAVLDTCAHQKIPIHSLPIDTIYIDGNAGSHFRPLSDSLRIGSVLLGCLFRFLLSSGLSYVIDIGLCWSLLYLLRDVIDSNVARIGLSVVLARTISMLVNYSINKTCVFHVSTHAQHCFQRYLLLAVVNMLALTVLIYGGHIYLGIHELLATMVSGGFLFMMNYQLQRIWVFSSTDAGGAL